MLKRLLELMGAVEAGRTARRTQGRSHTHPERSPGDGAHRTPIAQDSGRDLSAFHTYAISEGIDEERVHILSAAYADSVAEGRSDVYSLVYAAAYSIARSVIGASEEWARAYASACADAITAGESIGFASMYAHSVADGAPPRDALAFARRYAA